MMIPTHQMSAVQRLLPKGKPRVKALKLSIIGVMGCIFANNLSPRSIESTGTNPELTKGKIKSGSISPLDPSTVFESNPHMTASNEIAMFTIVRSPMTSSQLGKLPWGRKPRRKAVPIMIRVEIEFLTTPAPVWPIRTAVFEIDRVRKRSMIPFVISVVIFIAEYCED